VGHLEHCGCFTTAFGRGKRRLYIFCWPSCRTDLFSTIWNVFGRERGRRFQEQRPSSVQIRKCPIDALSSISNNVGSVKLFLSTLLSFHLKEFSLSLFVVFLLLRIDDHGSFVIFRATSVRPNHLFDQNFDHDYLFKLPFQGAGCPFKWTTSCFMPWTIPSCPAYEPNSNDGEYSQPFRHIQYKRTPSFRPIATLAMLLCRRIAR